MGLEVGIRGASNAVLPQIFSTRSILPQYPILTSRHIEALAFAAFSFERFLSPLTFAYH
jgi:hypothetical protein